MKRLALQEKWKGQLKTMNNLAAAVPIILDPMIDVFVHYSIILTLIQNQKKLLQRDKYNSTDKICGF